MSHVIINLSLRRPSFKIPFETSSNQVQVYNRQSVILCTIVNKIHIIITDLLTLLLFNHIADNLLKTLLFTYYQL